MPIAPLLRTFTRFEDLEPARAELLAAGLPPSAVQSRMLGDEAGPVEGNFVSGNGRTTVGANGPDGVITGGRVTYDENFQPFATRGIHLLVVEAQDEGQRRQAAEILDRYDTADPGGAPGAA